MSWTGCSPERYRDRIRTATRTRDADGGVFWSEPLPRLSAPHPLNLNPPEPVRAVRRFCWHSSIKHGNLEEQWVAGAGLYVFNPNFCVFRVVWTSAVMWSVEQTSRRGEEAGKKRKKRNSCNSVASKILIRVELATCCWIYVLRVTSLHWCNRSDRRDFFFFFFLLEKCWVCWSRASTIER